MTVWLLKLSGDCQPTLFPLGPSLINYKSLPVSWQCKNQSDRQTRKHLSHRALTREQHIHTLWKVWVTTSCSSLVVNRPEATTAEACVFIRIVPVRGSLSHLAFQTRETNSPNLSFYMPQAEKIQSSFKTTKPNITAFPNVTLLRIVHGQKLTRREDRNVILLGERQFSLPRPSPKITKNKGG